VSLSCQTTQRSKQIRSDCIVGVDVSDEEDKGPGRHLEVDLLDVLRQRFSTGQGFIQLSSDMTDDIMLGIIKHAISLGNGKAFTVIPPSPQRLCSAQGLQGFIQLFSGMTDEEMLFVIKRAISLGNGKAFTVTPPSKTDEESQRARTFLM
jgi:hypothetical protein